MLGYCHNDECGLDIWNPGEHNHILNRAFSPYAKHEQEKEDVIKMIVEVARLGTTSMSISLDDDFSEEDAKYIEKEVLRRLEEMS
jgi:hypothetical protein